MQKIKTSVPAEWTVLAPTHANRRRVGVPPPPSPAPSRGAYHVGPDVVAEVVVGGVLAPRPLLRRPLGRQLLAPRPLLRDHAEPHRPRDPPNTPVGSPFAFQHPRETGNMRQVQFLRDPESRGDNDSGCGLNHKKRGRVLHTGEADASSLAERRQGEGVELLRGMGREGGSRALERGTRRGRGTSRGGRRRPTGGGRCCPAAAAGPCMRRSLMGGGKTRGKEDRAGVVELSFQHHVEAMVSMGAMVLPSHTALCHVKFANCFEKRPMSAHPALPCAFQRCSCFWLNLLHAYNTH